MDVDTKGSLYSREPFLLYFKFLDLLRLKCKQLVKEMNKMQV